MEEWKDIEGYEGLYQVSNMGRVKSLHFGKEKILKTSNDGNDYQVVVLCKHGEHNTLRVHKLVAVAFVDGYFKGAVVNHIDENKQNNVWTNLEWCTQRYNVNYSYLKNRYGLDEFLTDYLNDIKYGDDRRYLTHRYIKSNVNRRRLHLMLNDMASLDDINEVSREINDTIRYLKNTERNTDGFAILVIYLRELKKYKKNLKKIS